MNFGEAETLSITLDINKRSALNKKFSSLKISIHMLGYSKTSKRSKICLKFICGFFGENDICFQKSVWSQTNQTFLWTEFLAGTFVCHKDSEHKGTIVHFSCLILLQFFSSGHEHETAYCKIINMLAYIYEFLLYTKNCGGWLGWWQCCIALIVLSIKRVHWLWAAYTLVAESISSPSLFPCMCSWFISPAVYKILGSLFI